MRIYFHLAKDDEFIRDPEGVEVADLEEARAAALNTIAELRHEDPAAPRDWSGWSLRVTDAAGRVLFTLPLVSGH
jgi:hypothetical protein